MSGDVIVGVDTSCSADVSTTDGDMKGFGYESTPPLLCAPLDPEGSWRRCRGSRFGVLVLRELKEELVLLLLRLDGSRLGRLVRNMLELWGSRRRVLVFKGSRRKVLETSGSRRMVLEWGLMLLVTVTSGWGFTVGTDGDGSWIRLGSVVKLLTGLTWLVFLPWPEENQRGGCTEISRI